MDLVLNLYILSNVAFCHKIYPHHPILTATKCLKLLSTYLMLFTSKIQWEPLYFKSSKCCSAMVAITQFCCLDKYLRSVYKSLRFFLQTIDQGFQWCLGPSVLRVTHMDLVLNIYILSNVEFCHKIYPHHPILTATKCLKLLLTY